MPDPTSVPALAEHAPAFPAPELPPDLDTPALVADAVVVEQNVTRMQRTMDERNVSLRPHAKTHKCLAVAQMQLEAGASGITVGTLGEAEVFAQGGIGDLFLAYPMWASGPKVDRLHALLDRVDLLVGVDNVDAARMLGRVAREAGRRVRVSIEVDSGERRSGTTPELAGDVATAAGGAGLEVIGVFTHGGHTYRQPGSADQAADDEIHALSRAKDSVLAAGFDVQVVSAGSTPTAHLSAREPITEERPGTYVFGDRQQVALGGCDPADIGLFVAATVVSRSPDGGRVVLDAGAKALARDRKPWVPGYAFVPAYPDAVVSELYDYHAVAEIPDGVASPDIGEIVAVVPNHVCPVVNLFERITVLRHGAITDTWAVDARARSS
jgi:D-serine deaminase-like pyridoxal phosphate-dependent protein